MLIDTADTILAITVSALLTLLLAVVASEWDLLGVAILTVWVAVWFAYFVVLKRSRFRTPGYILAGARIVNLQGETPSFASLLGRLLFVVGGPVNFILDLVWISSDPSQQAIRDKFAHTYVIKKSAVPAGTGAIVYRTYAMFGTTFLFREVQTESSSGGDALSTIGKRGDHPNTLPKT